MTADRIIAQLGLTPHPEGGHFRETWVAAPGLAADDTRATATAIYFLLKAHERSHWHKVDADEIWLYHAGAPLALDIAPNRAGPSNRRLLTPDITQGRPQICVPAHHWQAARSTGDYTLVSCIVSPGFRFSGFTLAPADFDIPNA